MLSYQKKEDPANPLSIFGANPSIGMKPTLVVGKTPTINL